MQTDDVIKAMRSDFKATGLKCIGKWDPNGQISCAQLRPKHKDPLHKERPVIPMHKAFTRLASNRAARFLNAVASRRYADRNYVLWKTFDLADKTAADEARLRALGPSYHAIVATFDATGMFTNLPHSTTLIVLDELEAWCYKHGMGTAHIRVRGRGGVLFGKCPDKGKFVTVEARDLFNMARFDIRWLYFTLGPILLKQIFGYPMGMPSSHPLSVLMCAWSEDRFAITLGIDSAYLSVTRYVDDIRVLAFYDSVDPLSLTKARALIARIRTDGYDPNLTLELTSTDNHAADFLDSVTIITNATQSIHLTQIDKNTRHLLAGRGRVIVRYQHFHTYAPAAMLLGIVVSQLYRVSRNTTRDGDVVTHILAYALELRALAYPLRVLRRATTICSRRFPERPVWRQVESLLWHLNATYRDGSLPPSSG
jgi:hypothetical protein